MTVIAVPCPPPGINEVHERLDAELPLSGTELTQLIAAVCQDTLLAVVSSGGEPLIVPLALENPLPAWDDSVEVVSGMQDTLHIKNESIVQTSEINESAEWAEDLFDVARAESDAASLGICLPKTPLVQRRHLDAAAMRLRRNDITLGPSTGGRWYFLGCQRTIDLEAAGDPGKTKTILEANESTSALASIPFLPGFETVAALVDLQTMISLTEQTGAPAAPHTKQWFESTDVASESRSIPE